MNFLFLNQWAIWFLPALSIPIIIHMIFKKQYRVVDWAAIQFLIEAEKRIRRKLRLIEILLLILRCLVVAALVLLFARLLLKDDLNLLPGQNQGNDHVFLIDNSPSVDIKTNGVSSFTSLKKRLLSFIDHLALEKGDHRVTVISWVDGKSFVKETNLKDDIEGVKSIIDSIKIVDAPVNYLTGLRSVDTYKFKNENSYKAIYYISDFQNSFIQKDNAENVISSFENQLKSFNEAHCFSLPNPIGSNNLSIESVENSNRMAIKDVPFIFKVKVKNNGTRLQKGVEVSMVGENKLPIVQTIEQINPNEEIELEFAYTFKEIGPQKFQFLLPDDDNNKDNIYYQSMNVRTGCKVLVVVSESSLRENESESYFISNSLNPPGKQYSGNICFVKSENEFSSLLLNEYNIIYICNLFQINSKMLSQLDQWVKGGGKLIISMGDQIDVQHYNEHLFKSLDMSVQIQGSVYAGDEKYANIIIKNSKNSCLTFFKNENSNFLDGLQFYQWYKMSIEDKQSSQLVAAYKNENQDPCIVQFERGDGNITLFTSTMDNKWNNWPSEFSFVILNLELVRQGLKNPYEGLSIIAGENADLRSSAQYYENKSTIKLDNSDEVIDIVAETTNNSLLHFKSNDLHSAGFFNILLHSYDGSELQLGGDINLHRLEGDPTKYEIEQSKLKENQKIKFHELSWFEEDGGLDKKNEIWKYIVILLFVFLSIESIFAWFAGRSR